MGIPLVGWVAKHRQAWSNANLERLAEKIRSPLVLCVVSTVSQMPLLTIPSAHVRASTQPGARKVLSSRAGFYSVLTETQQAKTTAIHGCLASSWYVRLFHIPFHRTDIVVVDAQWRSELAQSRSLMSTTTAQLTRSADNWLYEDQTGVANVITGKTVPLPGRLHR